MDNSADGDIRRLIIPGFRGLEAQREHMGLLPLSDDESEAVIGAGIAAYKENVPRERGRAAMDAMRRRAGYPSESDG